MSLARLTPPSTWIAVAIAALVILGGLSGDHFNIPQALVSCPGKPAILKVANIAEGRFLPLKSKPAADAAVAAHLPHDGRDLQLRGCRTVSGHKYRWCRVTSTHGDGWADSYYLTVQKTEVSTITHTTGAAGGCNSHRQTERLPSRSTSPAASVA